MPYPLSINGAELAIDLPYQIAVSALCKINTGTQQLRGFVECEVCGFWRKTDRDKFGLVTGINNADRVRPSKTVLRPRNVHNRGAKFLDVTDRALVLRA
jgi:hypothetical protein